LLLNVGEKLGHGHAQAACYGKHGLDGQIPFAAFDPAHVRPVQAAMIGKGLLWEALLRPQFPNSPAEGFLKIWHLFTVWKQTDERSTALLWTAYL
jgi:hypothetical protein